MLFTLCLNCVMTSIWIHLISLLYEKSVLNILCIQCIISEPRREDHSNSTSEWCVHLCVRLFLRHRIAEEAANCSVNILQPMSHSDVSFSCKKKRSLILRKTTVLSLCSPGYLGVSHLSLSAVLWSTVNQTTAGCRHLNALESWHWMGTWMRASSFSLFSENRGQKKTRTEWKCSS